MAAHDLYDDPVDGVDAARPHGALPKPCPVCRLAVPVGEVRCPRCHALLITVCSGACASCGSRTCLRGDEQT